MKFLRYSLILASLFLFTSLQGQFTEHHYNFNTLNVGNLDGQDAWVTVADVNGNGDLQVSPIGGTTPSHDGTNAVFFNDGGPGVGRTGSRKANAAFPYDFSLGGIYQIELDIHTAWWGCIFGIGSDLNQNDFVSVSSSGEANERALELRVANHNTNAKLVLLPDGNTVVFTANTSGWKRYRLTLNFVDNGGSGSLSLSYQDSINGNWSPIGEVQGVDMGLTPGSGDRRDPNSWDIIYLHAQGSLAGFDNLVVKQPNTGGLQFQFINFSGIPDMLSTDGPFAVMASASSGLPVDLSIVSGPATVSGGTISLTGQSGTVTVRASQVGDTVYAPAADVNVMFEVYDPVDFIPFIDLRNPVNTIPVFMPTLGTILLTAEAGIEHDNLLSVEVDFMIDGQTLRAQNWENGFYTAQWAPPTAGAYSLTTIATSSGGPVNQVASTFTVVQTSTNIFLSTFVQDEITPGNNTVDTSFVFPSSVGAYDNIKATLNIGCPPGGCDPWDRIGYVEARAPNGEWIEIIRYLTPYGVPCTHQLDVTDFGSIFQGKVDFRFHIGTNQNGWLVSLDFDHNAGTPAYKYSWVDAVWRGTYSFGDFANLQPVDTVDYLFPPSTESAKLRLVTTGHGWDPAINTGNAAEFYDATHTIKVNQTNDFLQPILQACNPNPDMCQPQNGTWFFDRAGWCPGAISTGFSYDLTPYVVIPSMNLIYEFDPQYVDLCHPNHPFCVSGVTCDNCNAGFNPHYVVAGNLITYSNSPLDLNTPIETLVEHTTIHIFPNPSNGQFQVLAPEITDAVYVEVFQTSGQRVYSNHPGPSSLGLDLTIDLGDQASGMYLIRVQTREGVVSKKLVIE